MPDVHSLALMIDRIRALRTVIEEGSVNRAALRLRITQPALSRQMQALENEIGGRLLERETSGVKPTGLGHALVKGMTPLLASYDTALATLRRQARGELSEVRVGYLISAAQSVLTPALESLRRTHPALKTRLLDMSPREQIDALHSGEIDVALTGQEGQVAAKDFHSLTLRSLGVCVALPAADSLAEKKKLALRDLKTHASSAWTSTRCRAAIRG